jgi:LPS-assembly protein
MKNKILYICLFLFLSNFIYFAANSADQFNFDVTEIEIIEDGNIIKGTKKGTVKTYDGVTITANNFTYNKLLNKLTADGDVEIIDLDKNLKIYSDYAIYEKNVEIVTTKKNSKAVYGIDKFIFADSFKFSRNENVLNAKDNVRIKDTVKDHLITGDDFTYFKESEKIISKGVTQAFIKSKYKISSRDVEYSINENTLLSKNKTKIEDQKTNVYFTENFIYQLNQEILKGEKILIISNYNLPTSDKFYFDSAMINLKEQKFVGKNTEINLHKSIFDKTENDPRLKGVSSTSNGNITLINKGVFTSCKKNDGCPPWSLSASKIEHDKTKKQLLYDDAVLKIYDLPVLYFPKFFHPDPSVKRQSGLLKPEINSSNILGSSLTLPYFKVITENKDLTITPTVFDSKTLMSVAEYREINKNSKIFADVGFVNGYKSKTTNKKNSLSHLFLEYDLNLDLENYLLSDLKISLEKVSNDKYLKIFDPHITKSKLRPNNFDKLNNSIKMFLNHENFNFESGIQSYENLQITNQSDRYQYIMPYYSFDKSISQSYISGNINFNSNGSNNLDNTNNLKTAITNNLTYNSYDFISNLGIKSNLGFNIQNLNSVGKKVSQYKSSPQIELAGLFNVDLSLPLSKEKDNFKNFLTPKLSFRFSPNDMKNYSTSENKIDVNNVFAMNRLGLSDTLETGRSMTLGLDFKKEKKNNLNDINNYFEIKLATVLRDKEENFIPNKSSLNRKNSNLFGSITNKFSDNLDFVYNFSIDNDYNTFQYNDLNATISVNNFITTFNFIEENGDAGDTNVISNSIAYNLNDKNFFKFETRRNRKINLTEYYDLVYEYKNDCLTAGIKYKKTYYSDGDLKPTENLLFTITLFPLTTYEYAADEILR